MGFTDLLDRILLKPYLAARGETYYQARDLALILLAVAAIVGGTLALSNSTLEVRLSLIGLLSFCVLILLVIRVGYAHIATAISMISLGGLASAIFFQGDFHNYEAYALTTIHLFILLIATLLTYQQLYAYITMAVSAVILVSHYSFRALPLSVPGNQADVDDLIVCVGLLLVAGMIASRNVGRRKELMRVAEDESALNRQRAIELEKSRAVLDAVIDQSPIPMIIAAPDGTITSLNSALLEYAGVEGTGVLQPGMRLSETGVTWEVFDIDGTPIPLERMPLRESLSGIVTPGREMRFQLKDGTSKWAIQHATPIYDTQGNMVAGFSVFADISERKAAEEALRKSEEKYRHLIQNSGEAIYLLYDR